MLRQFFNNEKDSHIDPLIENVIEEMHRKGVLSDDYPALMTHLERLHEIKVKERQDPVSRDTLAMIAGNLMGILLIVAYEQKHVMTSKGLTQIIRPRSNT